MAAHRRKKPTRRDGIRAELMQEWFGCQKPTNLGRNISTAGDWVDDILKSQFFAESIDEQELRNAWKEIAGDFIGSQTEPVSVKNGNLVLRVTQPAMRFHLEQMKPELLKNIKARFGAGKIKSIRFGIG